MTPRVGILVSFFAMLALAGLLHWAAWRWCKRAAPKFMARFRWPLLVLYVTLFAMPLARAAAFFHVRSTAWAMVAAVGMLWHLTLALTMAAVGFVKAGRALHGRFVARREPLAIGGASPDHRRNDFEKPAKGSLETRNDVDGREGHAIGGRGHDPIAPDGASVPSASDAARAPLRLDRREILERAVGAAALAASGTTMAWGTVRGRYEWSIEEVPIRLAKLPKALDGFTIVQISDLHVGTFVGQRELDLGLSLLDRIRVDLIAITGDIVDADPHFVPIAARKLGALKARYGIFAIPGNHDYYTGEHAVLGGLRRAGIDVLVNRGKVVAPGDGGGFALLGVDDLSARRGSDSGGPDLALARSMVAPDLATVLLAHQPRFANYAARSGIDLQLSGHTHGGQINPGFRLVDLLYRYVEGRYEIGATQLYVNRGFGTVGPPTRVGAPPEITKIVLVAG